MASAKLELLGVTIDHPSGRERAQNPEAKARVSLLLRTEAGRSRDVELSEDDLVRLIADASKMLAILKGVRVR